MPKHSKNKTGGPIFTSHERCIIKNSTEYGNSLYRLTNDNHKKLEQCGICFKKVNQPLCCSQGHIFCKECLVENFIKQKKIIKEQSKIKQKGSYSVKVFSDPNTEKATSLKLLNYYDENNAYLDDEHLNKKLIYLEKNQLCKDQIKFTSDDDKKKENFWLPENSTVENIKKEEKLLLNFTVCPIGFHKASFSEYFEIIFDFIDEINSKCSSCGSCLGFNKVYSFQSCGHIICSKCISTIFSNELEDVDLNKNIENKLCCVKCDNISLRLIKLQQTFSDFYIGENSIKTRVEQNFKC